MNAHVVDGYVDATAGPMAIVALGSFDDDRLELFAQGGPRWGDGGLRGNAGAGANIWFAARVGLRLEYQYQWENSTFSDQKFGPTGPVGPPATSDRTLGEHVIRLGIAFR